MSDEGVRIIHRAEVDAEVERLRAENESARLHITSLLEIADLALYYAPGEIGEGFEQANGAVIRARAFLANEK